MQIDAPYRRSDRIMRAAHRRVQQPSGQFGSTRLSYAHRLGYVHGTIDAIRG
jgi:hypothetical protein